MAAVSVPLSSRSRCRSRSGVRSGAGGLGRPALGRSGAAVRRARTRLALALALLAWLVVLVCAVLGAAGSEHTRSSGSVLSSGRTHTVAAGESLWSIAESVGGGSTDTRAVVGEIVALNHLGGTGVRAGQVLVLP